MNKLKIAVKSIGGLNSHL